MKFTDRGIYVSKADVYVDPWRPVNKALITHAHADHSRWGMKHYLAHHHSIPIMKHRLGRDIKVQEIAYGEPLKINGVSFSFHPAGHIPGSAQIAVSHKDQKWVVSGDYKLESDGLSIPFETVDCSHFISECTFGLPVYKWPDSKEVLASMKNWIVQNRREGVVSVILAYALGKSQRIIHGLANEAGTAFTHGAVEVNNELLEEIGYHIPSHQKITADSKRDEVLNGFVIAPSSVIGTPWLRKLKPYRLAMASGWMQLRGAKRRRNVDKGFVLSDHADWIGLNAAIEATGAEHIYVTHGYTDIFSTWLKGKGYKAHIVQTDFTDNEDEEVTS